jgi:hypothetical protein
MRGNENSYIIRYKEKAPEKSGALHFEPKAGLEPATKLA